MHFCNCRNPLVPDKAALHRVSLVFALLSSINDGKYACPSQHLNAIVNSMPTVLPE